MMLRCEPCDRSDHNNCAKTVRAFIEPSGPDHYLCECFCARNRRDKDTADRKVREACIAYAARYGAEALAEQVSQFVPLSGRTDGGADRG